MKRKIVFHEEQTFVGTRTWYFLLAIAVVSITPGIGIIKSGENVETGWAALVIALVVMILVIAMHAIMTLQVTVDSSAIYYRYPPFVRKERRLTKTDIQAMNIRKYRPIWEFGGYGYRYRLGSGRALNVSGKDGLQIVLANGKRLLIGTQKPEELGRIINQLKENWIVEEGHG